MGEIDEILTIWTIRFAVFAYITRLTILIGGWAEPAWRWSRAIWTAGFAAYLVHVIGAFHFVHDWSHAAAVAHTAERTGAVTGWYWGGGVWFNYVFTLLWCADVLGWWMIGSGWLNRSRRFQRLMQSVFAFMMFNATVVFGPIHWRWLGIALASMWGFLWSVRR